MATTDNPIQHLQHCRRIGLSMILCVVALFSAIEGRSTAWAGKPGPITLTPFKNVQSMQMTLTVRVDGKTKANKVMRGSLSVDSQYNKGNDQRKFSYSGSLVSTLYSADAKMKSMGLTGITFYKLGATNHVLLNGKKRLCYPTPEDSTQFLSAQFSAESVLDTLNLSKPIMIGTPVAEETRNGVRAVRYRLDAKATAAQFSANTGMSMTILSGSVWLAKADGHLVRIETATQGTLPYFINSDGFSGKANITIDFSKLNEAIEVALPKSCSVSD